MRVLQINAVYEYSSTGRTTTELHEYYLAHGIDSYVAANNVTDGDRFIRLASPCQLRWHSLMSHLTGLQGYFSHFATHHLLQRIGTIKPDVVHLRVIHSNCVNLPMLLGYLAQHDIATVITLHDCWFFTGHCCYFVDSDCERWKTRCGHCPDRHKWNSSWLFDTSSKCLADKRRLFADIPRLAVVGPSDWVTSFIKESILCSARIVRRIYNWTDLDHFRPHLSDLRRRLGLEGDFVVVGVAQNWTPTKGLEDIKRVATLRPQYKFLLVGNVPKEFRPLPSNVMAVGVTASTDELADYYASADVFLNPSTRETFGKVTTEALACGTPVVAYNLTATPELIQQGCGYVCTAHDINAVLTSLDTIHSRGKAVYSQACVLFATSNFDKYLLIEEYISLYKELLGK